MKRSTVYNQGLTSEEKLSKVNPQNLKLLKEFINYMRASDKSPETISAYENDINIFFCWAVDNIDNKFFIELKNTDVMNYQSWILYDLNASSARTRRLKASLSSMSNFIIRMKQEQYPTFRNIMNTAIEAPPQEKVRDNLVLSDEQVYELLDDLIENKEYQIACYVALAAFSGARKSELLRFKVEYFNEKYIKSGLYVTPEKIKTKGRGKAGKPLNKSTIVKYFKPYFDIWMEEREKLGIDSEWLFVAKRDGGYGQAKVYSADNWVKKVKKILGLPFYSHAMRHFYCSSLKRANIPDDVIVELVGWESVEMIKHYNDNSVMDTIGDYFNDEGVIVQEKKTLNSI